MRIKARKKVLYILAVSALLMGVSACRQGQSGEEDMKIITAGENEAKEIEPEAEGGSEGTKGLKEADDSLPAELETAPEDIDFQTGTWDGLTFTNPWIGLKITLPEGSYVYTEEDMQSVVGAGQEILVNGGNYTDMEMRIAEAVTVYDFMAVLPDGQSNMQLAYENVRLTTRGEGISAEEYLDTVWQQMSSIDDIQCEMKGKEDAEVGGGLFAKMSVSLMGDAVYQDYYGMCRGSHMIVLTVSYLPESREVVDKLIGGIRADQ